MDWFETLTGFAEGPPDAVRALLVLDGAHLTSRVNGRRMVCGRLEMPSLSELRARVPLPLGGRALRATQVVGDVADLHRDAAHAGALFQAASQFNLLEMVAPGIRPEDGIARYALDATQGPACAVSCGAGTIYRNYFVPVDGRTGQTEGAELDCLAGIGAALGNDGGRLWQMRNGYALPVRGGLAAINARLQALDAAGIDALRGELRIGLQRGTEVTLGDAGHLVSQAYCSALPVAYGGQPAAEWERFALLVLEAAYEATLYAAWEAARAGGSDRVFLTLLGGGVFGNDERWILRSLARALRRFAAAALDVRIVAYGRPHPGIAAMLEAFG